MSSSFSLYYKDGLTMSEIAEVLGVSERHVRGRHGRAVAYLCSQLGCSDGVGGQGASAN
ncbi:MAG: sigma factor-like helix-turn-helix DNA-binding protein [Anaerolineae bacterium]